MTNHEFTQQAGLQLTADQREHLEAIRTQYLQELLNFNPLSTPNGDTYRLAISIARAKIELLDHLLIQTQEL